MKKIALFILMFLTGVGFGYSQKLTTKEKRALREHDVKEMIDNRDFVFQARSASPESGPTVNFSTYYDFSISGMEVESWLPYYGETNIPEYGEIDGGLKFREEASLIDVQFVKKTYIITIEVETENDNYDIKMTLGKGGCGYLVISSGKRDVITFYGAIEKTGSLNVFIN